MKYFLTSNSGVIKRLSKIYYKTLEEATKKDIALSDFTNLVSNKLRKTWKALVVVIKTDIARSGFTENFIFDGQIPFLVLLV